MASRAEEKQRRREERVAREQAEKAAAARKHRLQWVGGAVLALAAIAGVIVLIVAGGGKSGGDSQGGAASAEPVAGVTLPQQQIANLDEAAKAAGCEVQHPPIEGRGHATKAFKPSDYKTNPPTSGEHYPSWYEDGVYAPGSTPNLGELVHTLEHGRIDVQYQPGTPKKTVSQLETLLAEQENGYHMLLFQNTTGMKYAVAATAWGHLLGCPTMNDKVFDAIRTFRERYIDKGPEAVA
jgi:hypothetical protein